MPEKFCCPTCGSEKWNAIEQISSLTPCEIFRNGEVEMDSMAEFVRNDSTSVILAYTCFNEECGHTILAADLMGAV